MLIGFLVALAILMPINIGYLLIGLEAERYQAFASIPLIVFFYLFGQFATYRARRYRMTRTVWRGVRFWMTGSGWIYALQASRGGGCADGFLTLGLILAMARGRHSNATRCAILPLRRPAGQLRGGAAGSFFKRGLVAVAAPRADRDLTSARLRSPFFYAGYKAIEWRWWLSGIRFGGVRLEIVHCRRAR